MFTKVSNLDNNDNDNDKDKDKVKVKDKDNDNEITVFTKVSNLDKFRRGTENVLRLEVAVEETIPLNLNRMFILFAKKPFL